VSSHKILLRRLAAPSVEWSFGVRATTRRLRGLSIMQHDIWNAITNTNPGLAGTLLLAGFIGVMAWVWWPAGFLLP
jgi:hypothetical protein